MKVEKPIFVVGVGRSGSSVFHRIFSEHPQVAWMSSRLCDRVPSRPSLNRLLMAAVGWPLLGELVRKRYPPGEGYGLWEYYCKGFSCPCRDLRAQDVTKKVKTVIPQVMSAMLTRKRSRLLVKVTGWPRIGFLHEIFGDAKFIHVTREGEAVINSIINVDFWEGWRGPQNWRWGELTPSQRQEWEQFDRSFVALAGLQLRILADAMELAKRCVSEQDFLQVRYEDLCASPVQVFMDVFDFCGLEPLPKLESVIQKYHLRSRDDKWRQELTDEQKRIAEHFARGG